MENEIQEDDQNVLKIDISSLKLNISQIKITKQQFKNKEISNKLQNKVDLIPGEYEGGIKLWEGSVDLTKFLPMYLMKNNSLNFKDLKVLELGCGHGFPGLLFLEKSSILKP